ncbi:MAG: aconitase family protein [Gemmataceae bacterium]
MPSPMTMTEKILARASGKAAVEPGENVWVNIDVLMTHDVCGPGTFGVFKKNFGENAKVWDREKVVVIPDHYIFTQDAMANRNVDVLRAFAKEQNLKYFYDVGTKDYKGVCHIALPEEGHTRPGEVLLGTDSHTCTAGAFGEFATGIGNTDAGFVLGTGKLWLKTPPTMRFVFHGKMPPWLMAKDLILAVIGDIGVDGATYRAMEFDGDGIFALNIEERMTLCNMAIEAGGKNGIIAPDQVTFDYVNKRNAGQKPYTAVYTDPGAKFIYEKVYDVSKMEPVLAKPHSPDNKANVSEVKGTKLDRPYIGSCTGSKLTDFKAAARNCSTTSVKIDTFVVPATARWPTSSNTGEDRQEEPAGHLPECGREIGDARTRVPRRPRRHLRSRLNTPDRASTATNLPSPSRMGTRKPRCSSRPAHGRRQRPTVRLQIAGTFWCDNWR